MAGPCVRGSDAWMQRLSPPPEPTGGRTAAVLRSARPSEPRSPPPGKPAPPTSTDPPRPRPSPAGEGPGDKLRATLARKLAPSVENRASRPTSPVTSVQRISSSPPCVPRPIGRLRPCSSADNSFTVY
jgi:hypothetical protein